MNYLNKLNIPVNKSLPLLVETSFPTGARLTSPPHSAMHARVGSGTSSIKSSGFNKTLHSWCSYFRNKAMSMMCNWVPIHYVLSGHESYYVCIYSLVLNHFLFILYSADRVRCIHYFYIAGNILLSLRFQRPLRNNFVLFQRCRWESPACQISWSTCRKIIL